MSVEYTGKVQIFEHGGLEPLIRLLSSPDPDVKKNSIECIYNLVQVGMSSKQRSGGREYNSMLTCLPNTQKANCGNGVGEMAQRLRALVALPLNPGSVPSTHTVAYNHL